MYSEKGNELNPFILSVPLFIQFISLSAEDTHSYMYQRSTSLPYFSSLIISSLQTELTPNRR